MPIKIIIADNEPKILKGMTACIDRGTLDIDMVSFAVAGSDFIDQYRELMADICIIDICTPQFGGLEAIEKIRGFNPECRFIITSENEDFKSARFAIDIGASGYILKPFKTDEITKCIEETAEKIQRERENAKLLGFALRILHTDKHGLFEEFIQKWILRQHSEEDVEYMLGYLGLNEYVPHTMLLIDHPVYESASLKLPPTKERVNALHHAIQKMLGIDSLVLWAPLTHRRSLGIVKKISHKVLERIETGVLEAAGKKMGLEFIIVICTTCSLKIEFHSAYKELCNIMGEKARESPIVETVEIIIKNEYMDKGLSLKSVAVRMHINSQYLSRLFKSKVGMSFSEYLIQTRTRNAISLMVSSNAQIHDVSDHVGYRSQHYFSNAFKKATGYSPSEYRMKYESMLHDYQEYGREDAANLNS